MAASRSARWALVAMPPHTSIHYRFLFPHNTGPLVPDSRGYVRDGWRVTNVIISEGHCGVVDIEVRSFVTRKGTVDGRCCLTIVHNPEFVAQGGR